MYNALKSDHVSVIRTDTRIRKELTVRRRIVAAALVAAATLSLVGAGTASAAPSSTSATVTSALYAPKPSLNWRQLIPQVRYHWWGQSYRFNGWQTRVIASGAGGALGAALGATPGAAFGLGAAQQMAQEATAVGYCLQLNRTWATPMTYVPTYWRC